jgi:hypothetical protein
MMYGSVTNTAYIHLEMSTLLLLVRRGTPQWLCSNEARVGGSQANLGAALRFASSSSGHDICGEQTNNLCKLVYLSIQIIGFKPSAILQHSHHKFETC